MKFECKFIVSAALFVGLFALIVCREEADWIQEDWTTLFGRVFGVVESEFELSARQVQLILTELSTRVENGSSEFSEEDANEVRFWIGITNVTEDNCKGDYDRRVLNRFEARALIALPERLDENQRWNLKAYAKSVRNQQLYFCLGQLGIGLIHSIETIPRTSSQAISRLVKQTSYNIAYALAQFYEKPKWISVGDKGKDRAKFEAIYKENVLDHCEYIRKPLEEFSDFVDYFASYDFYPKVCPTITKWYELVLLCDKLQSDVPMEKVRVHLSEAIDDYYKTGLKNLIQ